VRQPGAQQISQRAASTARRPAPLPSPRFPLPGVAVASAAVRPSAPSARRAGAP